MMDHSHLTGRTDEVRWFHTFFMSAGEPGLGAICEEMENDEVRRNEPSFYGSHNVLSRKRVFGLFYRLSP